jgi:hypothetical protein
VTMTSQMSALTTSKEKEEEKNRLTNQSSSKNSQRHHLSPRHPHIIHSYSHPVIAKGIAQSKLLLNLKEK